MSDRRRFIIGLHQARTAILIATLVGSAGIEARADGAALEGELRIEARYQELGGSAGMLGRALNTVQRAFDGEGRYRAYENGFIYWHASSGAHVVRAAIRTRWGVLGAEMGALGYPTSDEETLPGGDARVSRFQRGEIEWRESSGMVTVRVVEMPVNGVPGLASAFR